MRYGVVTLLCLIFSAAGLVLGIMAKLEEDKFLSVRLDWHCVERLDPVGDRGGLWQ